MEFVTKADYAYQRLRDDILSGRIPAASKLVINDIAREYNISAMPIRNAITRLEQAGLVHSVPHIGVWVNDVNLDDYFSLMLLRIEAEALASIMTTENPGAKLIKTLEKLLKQMAEAQKNQDWGAYGRLNRNFHNAVYAECKNSVISEHINTLMQRTQMSVHTFIVIPSEIEESYEEHVQWLEAIKNRDMSKSAAIARQQLLRANLAVLLHLRRSMDGGLKDDLFTQAFQSGMDRSSVDRYISIFRLIQDKNDF